MSSTNWEPSITNTHAYVGRSGGSVNSSAKGAFAYVQKGTGHMIHKSEWEPQRTNNFELVIENLDSLLTAGGETLTPSNAAEKIMLSVDSFTAPSLEIASITTHYGNNSIKWAGKPDFPNSSLTINDYIGMRTEQILAAWFRCAYDFRTEKIGLAKDYKKTAFLIEYDPKGSFENVRAWRLEGCWLASFNLGEWSQEGNNQRKLQATLVYDRIMPDFGLTDSAIQQSTNSNKDDKNNNSNQGSTVKDNNYYDEWKSLYKANNDGGMTEVKTE